MLKELTLKRFKGFSSFRISFGARALLVGPNNAGKSTIIAALRLCSGAIRMATRRNPTETFRDGERWVRGFPLTTVVSTGFVSENVRHEFRDDESRLELKFTSGAVLNIVWPTGDQTPFFWVFDPEGPNNVSLARAKVVLTQVGVVPTLTPVEYDERKLDAGYLREKAESRLASRHFRNYMREIRNTSDEDYADLLAFILTNTPEMSSLEIADDYRGGNVWIDLYFRDVGSPTQKEIYWAGDGLQIWLQLLYQIWRHRASEVLVLDEPDVFLHPDLQRRLIGILESKDIQSIMASHAPEMINEAEQGSIVWVERKRRNARRVTDDRGLGDLATILGSSFNLSVARALRSKVALFVEGEDMKLLRILAAKVGCTSIAEEKALATIQIGGFSRWPGVEAFAWLKSEFLDNTVNVSVLLDRDYRSDASIESIESQLHSSSVDGHIWRRKGIENYLLDPPAISRVAGVRIDVATELLNAALDDFRHEVESHLITSSVAEQHSSGLDHSTITRNTMVSFDASWQNAQYRLGAAPGKQVISRLNQRLQDRGARTLTARKLAVKIAASDLDQEMVSVLRQIEERLSVTG